MNHCGSEEGMETDRKKEISIYGFITEEKESLIALLVGTVTIYSGVLLLE